MVYSGSVSARALAGNSQFNPDHDDLNTLTYNVPANNHLGAKAFESIFLDAWQGHALI